jgi:uncharacterized membrane protein YdbT with pleckstrin-like domain
MSYVEKILQPDEQIIHRASIHWVVYLRSIILLVLGCTVLGWFLLQPPVGDRVFFSGTLVGVGGVLLLASVYSFIEALIERQCTELAITSLRVIAKVGFIRRRTWEINAGKVEGVEVDQSILGRIFDYGTVTVKGTGGGTAPIRSIDDPVAFRAKITLL